MGIIPRKLRAALERLPRMKICTLHSVQYIYGQCSGRVRNPEWHHVWVYAGKQVQELWAILAGCSYHHDQVKKDPAVRMAFEAASLSLASEEDLQKYPRKDWEQITKSLGMKS